MTCATCGHENREGARFCDSCGAALVAEPGREERKVVTVLFADLVGFTARAEAMDPEDVRALLAPYHARLREELERYGGTVEKFIGDAVMALFGAPVAHEDDPERAVRAAVSIRDWIGEQGEDLQIRIAVNTGEALVALAARPGEGEGMASGDVVNTAARLQTAAPIDGILVGETTYRATRHVIEYREGPLVAAKGKATPIATWEAVGVRARIDVDLHDSPLVGRADELNLLNDALGRVRRERRPQLVTLVGVPGIGKSRLVHELYQSIESGSELTYWRRGRSLPYGEGVTFWALAEIVKAHAAVLESDTDEQVEQKLRQAVADVATDSSETRWLESHLRPLAGLGVERAPETSGRDEAFGAWRRFFELLAQRHPFVLVFEDLQWADDDLLDFIDHLVDWVSDVPLLVVCTGRPEILERRPGWGGGKLDAAMVSLAPLTDPETARLMGALLERAVLPAETQSALLARVGGNPLYAEHYARMLTEVPEGEELTLPESVQGIIAARLDGLSVDEKALLHDAAVLGKVFWLGGLTHDDRSRWQVEHDLHALERKGFVQRARRSSVSTEIEYGFRHLLVRDVAYGQIPRAARAEKHRHAAEWIESLGRPDDHAEMLAHHYLSALELGRAAGTDVAPLEERVRTTLRAAGDRAFGLHAFSTSVRYYEAALELWPPEGGEHALLMLQLGRALHLAGEARALETVEAARTALLAADEREVAADADGLLAEVLWYRGERGRVETHLRRARELLEGAAASPAKARVLAQAARFLTLAQSEEQAVDVAREALAMSEALGLRELQSHALNSLGLARAQLGDERGLEDVQRSIELALEVGSGEVVRAQNNLSALFSFFGDMRRGQAALETATDSAQRLGHAPMTRFLEGRHAGLALFFGDWDEALRRADAFIADCEAGSPHYMESGMRSTRGKIRLARGDDTGALDEVLRAVELARGARDPQSMIPALSAAAFVYAEAGRDEDARAFFDELLKTFGPQRVLHPGVTDIAWVADRLARQDALLELSSRVVRTPYSESLQLAASSDFATAADILAGTGAASQAALGRLRAAEAFVTEGRRAQADVQLAKALEFFRSVRATRYVREGEALLAAAS